MACTHNFLLVALSKLLSSTTSNSDVTATEHEIYRKGSLLKEAGLAHPLPASWQVRWFSYSK
jgi:hypothetical protein